MRLRRTRFSLAGFALPYLVVFALPLGIGAGIYAIANRSLERSAMEATMAVLEQGKTVLERQFAGMEHVVSLTAENPSIRAFQFKEDAFSGRTTADTLELGSLFRAYPFDPFFVVERILAFSTSRVVFSTAGVHRFEAFWELVSNIEGMDVDEWAREYVDAYRLLEYLPSRPIMLGGQKREIIPLVSSIGYSTTHRGSIVVYIDAEAVRKLFSAIDTSQGGGFSIRGRDGVPLIHGGKPLDIQIPEERPYSGIVSIEGEKHLLSAIDGTPGDRTYIAMRPLSVVMQPLRGIRALMFGWTVASAVAALLLLGSLARRDIKPLRDLVATLNSRGLLERRAQAGLSALADAVRDLVTNRDSLERSLSDHQTVLRDSMLDRVLRGDLGNADDPLRVLGTLGLTVDAPRYVVLSMRFEYFGGEETPFDCVMLRTILESSALPTGCRIFYRLRSSNELTALACHESEAQLDSIIEIIEKAAKSPIGRSFRLGVGSVKKEIAEISRSYAESRSILDHTADTSELVFRYESNELATVGLDYPLDTEQRLCNTALSGNEDETMALLDSIVLANTKTGCPDPLHEETLQRALLVSALRAAASSPRGKTELAVVGTQAPASFERARDSCDRARVVRDAWRTICHVARDHRPNRTETLKRQMMEYIETTYASSELSLTSTALRFGLSEVYVSAFFKEQTGINFNDYVERLRMAEARRLIAEKKFSLKEIAFRVGYSSAHSFGRAFKRANGVSPSAFAT